MMSGPRIAKQYVTNFLALDMPSRLLTYKNYWNLSDSQLPTPVSYLAYEPFTLSAWPTVITLVQGTTSVRRESYESDFDPNFRVTYSMRTYIWARATGAQEVTEMRDNLTTVTREALMDGASLSKYDQGASAIAGVPCYPKINESTINEEFSDLTLIKGERLLAGAYIAYDLSLEEIIDHDTAGIMQTHSNTISKMAFLPNAPTNVIAVAGDTQVTLGWTASTWDGGLYDVTGYKIESSVDEKETWSTVVANTGSTDRSYTATGLTNGVKIYFRVSSINAAGTGDASSASIGVTPASS